MIHATAASGWSLSGSIWTFAFPMALVILAATVLYLLFSRPHRIPGHGPLTPAHAGPPDAGTAQAMAAAAGLATAAGGGAAPLIHEPAGAHDAAETDEVVAGADGVTGAHEATETDGVTGADGATGEHEASGADGTDMTSQADDPGTLGPEAGE